MLQELSWHELPSHFVREVPSWIPGSHETGAEAGRLLWPGFLCTLFVHVLRRKSRWDRETLVMPVMFVSSLIDALLPAANTGVCLVLLLCAPRKHSVPVACHCPAQ